MAALPRRVGIVLNPVKRQASEARGEIVRAVAACGADAVVLETTVAEPGASQARRAVHQGCDLVIVAGGDGTVREVALGLRGVGVPLGIVPLGTANLFARNLRIPRRDRVRAIHIALSGPTRDLDRGLASFENAAGRSDWQAFLVLAGVGNDAATVLGTRAHLKDRLGWLAYAESAVRHVTRRPVAMTVRSDTGAETPVTAWSVLAGNCGKIPGGVVLFPRAHLDDGRLDTMVVTASHLGQWAAAGAKGLLRIPGDVPGITVGHARELWITPTVPIPVQLDGDVTPDVTGIHLRVEHRALRVRVPPGRF